MTTYVSTKDLHTNLKDVTDKVQDGHTVIVLKHSKPVYKMVPFGKNTSLDDVCKVPDKKYSMKDLDQFIFAGKDPSVTDLATTYKDILYK